MFERIQKILASHDRRQLPGDGLTPSAVLVPLFLKEERLHLLMGRRTERVLHHKRQIAFPGGVCDPDDLDAVDTALREAWEETGLQPDDVRVLGLLGDIQTITGYRVTPVVGHIPYPYDFEPNPVEMAELLLVPFEVFTHPRDHRREIVELDGDEQQVDFYGFQRHTIWGATARITRQLVELMAGSGMLPLEGR